MKTIIRFFVLITGFVSFAQQDAQYTQYMYNTITVNPAYAGSRGVLSLFGLNRTQWVGIDGAPVTNAFSMHTPIENSRVGIGATFLNDKIGPTIENSISADVSYTIPTSETYKLSFGVKGTGSFMNLDVSQLNPTDQNDPQFQNYSKFYPNIGAGVYLHSNKTYLGLSIPKFIDTKRFNNNDLKIFTQSITYYLIAGHIYQLNPEIKFKPALLTKIERGTPLQVDASATFMFNDKFVMGASYRWDASVSVMAGFQVSDGLYIGYAYDLETTKLRKYNSGSHEVFLRFELFDNKNKVTSPRLFF
jgi:type IX secretion system PorP/SprF family membrane protein